MDLNNREIALLFWLGVFLTWALLRADMRKAIWSVVRIGIRPVISVPLVVFALYIAGMVWGAAHLGVWDSAILDDTIIWFVAVGLTLFFNIEEVFGQDDFFERKARAAIAATVFVEVLVNVAVLPLPLELLLLPAITFLSMLSVAAGGQEDGWAVKRLVDTVLGVIGMALILFVAVTFILNAGNIDWGYLAKVFALPVWLTLGVLPFIYLLGLFAAYQGVFSRVRFLGRAEPGTAVAAMLALASSFHIRARKLASFNGPWLREIAEARSYGDARRICVRFLTSS